MKIILLLLICLMVSLHGKETIAILTPATHPSLEEIERGFRETIISHNPDKYNFVTYNAQGNKMLMHSEINEIMRTNPCLILTIGTRASQMMTEIASQKGLKIPIVFTSVNDPLFFHIIPTENGSPGYVTGVKELLNFEEEISLLRTYIPHLKKIVLVFNPTEPGLEKDEKKIAHILKENNVDLVTVEIFKTNELITKVPSSLKGTDALLILKDNTVVTGLDFLVKVCNNFHIPLMASDLDSPRRGASFGYGVHEIDFGIEAAHKALQILDDNLSPGDIPVTTVSQFTFIVNEEAFKKQGGK